MSVDARHLRLFLTIAEIGTITDAAAQLGVSQSTASRLLQALERHVGRRLIDRTTHHLVLTSDGNAFRHRAAAAVAALDLALDPGALEHLPLRVGYSWAAFGRRTTDLLAGWHRVQPDSPIELRRHDSRLAGLTSFDVDIAIVRELDDNAPFERRWLWREGRVAAVSATDSLATRASVDLDELRNRPIVVNTSYGTTTPTLWSDDPVAQPATIIDVDNTDDWLYTIATSNAVGVTSEATSHVRALSDVTYIPIEDAPAINVELAWHPTNVHPSLRTFVDHCAVST